MLLVRVADFETVFFKVCTSMAINVNMVVNQIRKINYSLQRNILHYQSVFEFHVHLT